MPGTFIFIATNRLKPGKLEAGRRRVPGLCELITATKQRILAFNEYVEEDGGEVGIVRVHPDAESMAHHI